MFRELQTFSFHTELSLGEILTRLEAEGSRRWGMGDSDSLGRYVRSGIRAGSRVAGNLVESRLRFFFEEDRCILDIFFESREATAEHEWAALMSYVQERLLPLVEADDIRETHDYSS